MSTFGSLMGGDSALKQYLTMRASFIPSQPGYKYSSFYAYFLDKGRQLESKEMPAAWRKEMAQFVKKARPVVKGCFSNAARFVLQDLTRFEYWEGYAHTGYMPVHHGWVVERASGALIDPTLRYDIDKGFTLQNLVAVGSFLPPRAYWGCGYSTKQFVEFVRAGGGSMVDRPAEGHPELRG